MAKLSEFLLVNWSIYRVNGRLAGSQGMQLAQVLYLASMTEAATHTGKTQQTSSDDQIWK